MKIAITGPLGHIGSKLIRYLPEVFQETIIRMLDNMLVQRYCSLFNLPETGNYEFTEGDILDGVDDFIKGADVVIHLAAITDAVSSFKNNEKVREINYTGTEIVAKACQKQNIPIIFLSTTSVYGASKSLVDEDCGEEDLNPQSPYAQSKLDAENLLRKM
ncbi:MAG: NAD-dependent epimerase/dehydratase family protein, partial [Candidatus Peribacteraceae bacterium]|nr:NAD-dependent epimerase/dehydratase family protein [Candidatus Peribacteraceae bacterium]